MRTTKNEAIATVAAAWTAFAPHAEQRTTTEGDALMWKLAEAVDALLDSDAHDLFVAAVHEAQPADAGKMTTAAATEIAAKWTALAAA